ncbi:FUN14 domain-containing protein 1-like protein [Dinothrombium tinctorium]|uniref:FUN14 domain-containing protein 1-like protein n=1 Tax=Dinothrombium tinctorium TaxID=1965070 RepID=A0A3S4QNI9_9ACAR|nr:FUN14 domain-containing protein 1-like protein [Dinothrombium tinctorium]RWS05107.1 FUN14 domain-containing protein 1-like protein [Dinothrombium tinctorium]RWS05753.1 FUN14 domain-containing protein 1-like protein [Dinothrombium tinctorium]
MQIKGDDDVFEAPDKAIESWCTRFYRDIRHSSAAKQITVGGIGGWISGFVFAKFGKAAATGVGVTILLLHVAQHNGYVRIDWKQVNNDVEKAKKEIEKRAEKDLPKFLKRAQDFVVDNALLAGGYAGGFFLGVASA